MKLGCGHGRRVEVICNLRHGGGRVLRTRVKWESDIVRWIFDLGCGRRTFEPLWHSESIVHYCFAQHLDLDSLLRQCLWERSWSRSLSVGRKSGRTFSVEQVFSQTTEGWLDLGGKEERVSQYIHASNHINLFNVIYVRYSLV